MNYKNNHILYDHVYCVYNIASVMALEKISNCNDAIDLRMNQSDVINRSHQYNIFTWILYQWKRNGRDVNSITCRMLNSCHRTSYAVYPSTYSRKFSFASFCLFLFHVVVCLESL